MNRDAVAVVFIDLFIIILLVYITHAEIGRNVIPTNLRLISNSGPEENVPRETKPALIELAPGGQLRFEGEAVEKPALWKAVETSQADSIMLLVDAEVTWTDAGRLIHEISTRGLNVTLVSSPAE